MQQKGAMMGSWSEGRKGKKKNWGVVKKNVHLKDSFSERSIKKGPRGDLGGKGGN